MAYLNITKANFEAEVIQSTNTVLLDFWAPWCGPCRMVAPIVEEIAKDHTDLIVGKVDVDTQMSLATRFGITSIPTLILLENGEVKAQSLGYRPKEELERVLGL
jgi:thioredoxin 1